MSTNDILAALSKCNAERDRLRARNERLREALESLFLSVLSGKFGMVVASNVLNSWQWPDDMETVHPAYERARAALANQDTDNG